MSVNTTHPEYDANLPLWLRARDVLAGEDMVKEVVAVGRAGTLVDWGGSSRTNELGGDEVDWGQQAQGGGGAESFGRDANRLLITVSWVRRSLGRMHPAKWQSGQEYHRRPLRPPQTSANDPGYMCKGLQVAAQSIPLRSLGDMAWKILSASWTKLEVGLLSETSGWHWSAVS